MAYAADELQAANDQILRREPVALTVGQAVVLDCRGMATLKVIPGAGATVTVTRVTTRVAATAGPAATASVVPAASSSSVTLDSDAADVDWPYLRVLSADNTGGSTTYVALV